MWRLFISASCLWVVACGGAGAAPATPSPPTALTPLLREVAGGGYVLFFRHAERDVNAISNADLLVVDSEGACVPGSELTAQGVADSVALGAAFARLGVRVDHVFASPTCRTRQMATLAFGSFEMDRALAWPEIWTEEEAPSLQDELPRLLGTKPPARANTVLVSHNGVLIPTRMGLDITLDQADSAVFRPLGDHTFEFVGTIKKSEWLQ